MVFTYNLTRSGDLFKLQFNKYTDLYNSIIKVGIKGYNTVISEKISNDLINKFKNNFGNIIKN